MNEPALNDLTQRLDRLEGENRRLKRFGIVGVVGIAALALTGQALGTRVPDVVEAERAASGRCVARIFDTGSCVSNTELSDEHAKLDRRTPSGCLGPAGPGHYGVRVLRSDGRDVRGPLRRLLVCPARGEHLDRVRAGFVPARRR